MIGWIADKIISRWLYSVSKQLMVEAEWHKHNELPNNALMLVSIAAALNRANGKLE